MIDFLKIEINQPPEYSYLWFQPDKNVDYKYALIYTDNPKQIDLLKKLEQKINDNNS